MSREPPPIRISEFHYKIAWRARGSYPGHHSSRHTGGGFEFRHHADLLHAPDPSRFDLRASLRNPFEELMVRVYSQSSAIPVHALVDVSASMRFGGRRRKLHVAAEFVASLAYSAYRTGDPFACIGCDEAVREDLLQPLSYSKASGSALAQRLIALTPDGADSSGLLAAAQYLGPRRALVFLVSDFHFPLALLSEVLTTLSFHQVVPVVLWDSAEYQALPHFGLARLADRETGRQRLLLLRPSLRAKLQARFEQRRLELVQCCTALGFTPLFIHDQFDPDAVTRYFYGGA